VPTYEINAAQDGPRVLHIATTETASAALASYRAVFGNYRRVWVNDETGVDLTFAELFARAQAEGEG